MHHPFGIDFGGTGIKGRQSTSTGDFTHDRCASPRPSRPARRPWPRSSSRSSTASRLVVPGRRHRARHRAPRRRAVGGQHRQVLDQRGRRRDFTEALGREVHVVNDADAAGLAEVEYGAAKSRGGLVMVITLGTGIGSAMIFDGQLVPNSEMGHLEIDGQVAESRAATSAYEREGSLGGVVRAPHDLLPPPRAPLHPRPVRRRRRGYKSWDRFGHLIKIDTEIVPRPCRTGRHRGCRPRRATQGGHGRLSAAVAGLHVLAQHLFQARRPRR